MFNLKLEHLESELFPNFIDNGGREIPAGGIYGAHLNGGPISIVDTTDTGIVTVAGSQVETLKRDELLALGDIGRAVLLALGNSAVPTQVDFRELRRGLYHFYYCYRGLPADLDSFKELFGDYTLWPWFMLEDSYPKIYPRRMRRNPELGIYIAETIRDGVVHETEVILQGYRADGMLEFLAYMPNGNISSRGEFRAGAEFSVGTSPYTCMACHYNSEQLTYDVVFPQMSRD